MRAKLSHNCPAQFRIMTPLVAAVAIFFALFSNLSCGVKGKPLPPLTEPPIFRPSKMKSDDSQQSKDPNNLKATSDETEATQSTDAADALNKKKKSEGKK